MTGTATASRPEAVVHAVARERELIANRMHDEVAPLLLAAQLRLVTAEEHGSDPAAAIAGARDLISESEARIHEIVAVLAATVAATRAGLDVRIADVVTALEEQFAVPIDLMIHAGSASAPLADVHADLLVAAVREGVVNAVRHGRADRIGVRLRQAGPHHLTATVENDGGRSRTAAVSRPDRRCGGHGLRTLRRHAGEHGAHVDLAVRPGRGATLTVTVPRARLA